MFNKNLNGTRKMVEDQETAAGRFCGYNIRKNKTGQIQQLFSVYEQKLAAEKKSTD